MYHIKHLQKEFFSLPFGKNWGWAFCFILFSCGNDEENPKQKIDPRQFKEQLMKVNKYELQKETDEINQYIIRNGWDMKSTATGLRYLQLKKGDVVKVNSGDVVKVNYKITLLDGTLCYSSDHEGLQEFKVEQDNVESGVHEAVLLMRVGEKSKFILPSHMAHGLRGDEDKIPPLSAIVVDLEVLEIN